MADCDKTKMLIENYLIIHQIIHIHPKRQYIFSLRDRFDSKCTSCFYLLYYRHTSQYPMADNIGICLLCRGILSAIIQHETLQMIFCRLMQPVYDQPWMSARNCHLITLLNLLLLIYMSAPSDQKRGYYSCIWLYSVTPKPE